MSKVSIIIPTFNVSKYIEKCIDSVLAQTYQDIEIIIVDDCSTDNTVEVINGYSDSRITLIQNEVNHGPSYSRNIGIRNASGKYIALLDSDDWWDSCRLEHLLLFENSKGDIDLLFDDIYFIQDQRSNPWSTFLKESKLKMMEPIRIELYEFIKYDLGFLKPLIKREFLNKTGILFNEKVKYGEDFLFFLEMLDCHAKAYIYPHPFYFYRSREGSLITEKSDAIPQILEQNMNLIHSNRFEAKVMEALEERKRDMEIHLMCATFIHELRQGKIFYVLSGIVKNPGIFFTLSRRSWKYIKRSWSGIVGTFSRKIVNRN